MTLPAAVSLRRVNHVIYPFLTSTHPSTSLVRPVRTDRPVIQRSVHNQRSFELMQRPIYTYLVSEVRKHTSFPGVFQPAFFSSALNQDPYLPSQYVYERNLLL